MTITLREAMARSEYFRRLVKSCLKGGRGECVASDIARNDLSGMSAGWAIWFDDVARDIRSTY